MNFDVNKDYYNILGVSPTATQENILRARDRLKFEDRVPFTEWEQIDEAYSILSDIETRREYDRQIKEAGSYSDINTITGNGDNYISYVKSLNKDDASIEIPTNVGEITSTVVEENKDDKLNNEVITDIASEIENPEIVIDGDSKLEEPEIENPEIVIDGDSKLEEPEIESNKDVPSTEEITNIEPEIEKPEIAEDDHELEEPKVEQIEEQPINIPEDKKTMSLKKASVIGGITGFALMGPVGAIGGVYLARRIQKGKLCKTTNDKRISKPSTQESRIEQEYNDKLKSEVDKILLGNHNNYNLAISKAKYENRIELIKAKIAFKKSIRNKKGFRAIQQLQIFALQENLQTLQSELEKVNNKILDSDQTKVEKLSSINQKLENVNELIDKKTIEDEKNAVLIKALQVYKSILKLRQKGKITRKKIRNTTVKIFKDGTMRQVDKLKNFGQNIVGLSDVSNQIDSVQPVNESRHI